jgi:hypothetical protein
MDGYKLMKKLLSLILISLFWLVPLVLAGSPHLTVLARRAATYDCSNGLMFGWGFEDTTITSGTPAGCSDGDTTATIANSPELSATRATDGSKSLRINAADENYTLDVTTYDLIDIRDIKVTFDIWVVTFPTSQTLESWFIELIDHEWDSYLLIGVYTETGWAQTVQARNSHVGTEKVVTTTTLNTGEWYSCEYQAKANVAGNDHYITCGGATSDEDDDDFGASYTGDGTGTLYFGDEHGDDGGTSEYYVDKIKITTSDRY